MRTVGEILRKARMEKRLTLADAEKQLRIREKYLLALEENTWEKLPSLPYIKGFLRNYSSFLGLKSEEIMAIFRRQFQAVERGGLLPLGLTYPLNDPMLRLTPYTAVLGVITIFIIFFFGYLFFQYKAYTSPPNITIFAPSEGELVTSDTVQVKGTTDTDAVVSVNNQKIAISSNGEFSESVTLSPGINTIVIESTGKSGKKRTVTRTIQTQGVKPTDTP